MPRKAPAPKPEVREVPAKIEPVVQKKREKHTVRKETKAHRIERMKREAFEKRRLERKRKWEAHKFKRVKESRLGRNRNRSRSRNSAERFLREH